MLVSRATGQGDRWPARARGCNGILNQLCENRCLGQDDLALSGLELIGRGREPGALRGSACRVIYYIAEPRRSPGGSRK